MKILLVEDDRPTSLVVSDILIAHNYTVNQAMDGQTGLELAKAFEYDLVLLDIMLPDMDGISVCRRLRSLGYQSPILLLTGKDSTTDRVMGLDAGADDYVVKPFEMNELLARVRALLRRGKTVPSSVIVWEDIHFDTVNNQVTCGQKPLRLTPKEYCLLELFLLNPKRVFSRKAVLEKLWDFADSPGEETVSTHIKCLRQKFRAAGASDPIETVHGLGYRLKTPSKSKEDDFSVKQTINQKKVKATTSKVWEKFKGKYVEHFAVLEQATSALATGQLTPELLQQAKYEAHTLAGSLGIFGLMHGSELARELEDFFQPYKQLQADDVKQIVMVVELLGQELQKTPISETEGEQSSDSPLILIVDDDLMLAERIRIEAIAWKLRVEVATDLEVARKVIAQTPPNVILLDLNFPSSTEDGLTLLHELAQQIPKIPVLVFSGEGSLANRLEVARLGGCIFLQKPQSSYSILKVVTKVLSSTQETSSGNRVMVVDKDEAALSHLTNLLQPLGVEVTTLSDPHQFWEVLIASRPDLLILDVEMPELNSLELCQVVRCDPKWYRIPIIFWSARTQKSEIDKAFAVGADDYINKSVEEAELTTRVLRRLSRIRKQQV
ncbi:transcriptional regulator [Scytonema hofmannii PCC 7110]|uniref:Transcriptional regulator n=1 Tax=Scytonema hofmannii PCC 7110 TaxID=128403 RepID=A0A139XFX4_9CYAN|nr:response regulator [Scytonema hofmannii]KYC43522.1 transcriptional regulator [Scytonema hofmannii PCC 7110]